MSNSWSLLFYLKKPRNHVSGPVPIYLRITVDSRACEISTTIKTEPAKWSSTAERIVGKSELIAASNDLLDVLHAKAIEARTKLIALGKPIIAAHIKASILNRPLEQHTIMQVFKEHNEKMEELIGKDYTATYLERFTITYKHTLAFLQEEYRVADLDIQKLDYEFIQKFEHWLKTSRNCAHNTTMKYLSYFKKIVLICIKRKWLASDPFAEFKMTKRNKKRIPLSKSELEAIRDKQFSTARLECIKDIFLFSCYTGLAYADVKKLTRKDLFVGIDGYNWIHCARKKKEREGSSSNIPLLPAAEKIISKYGDNADGVQHEFMFPVPSNQKVNEYLKEIGELCGITKTMTFHLARHTFATTVMLSNKVPIETVSRMLAHEKLSTTQLYAQVLDDKVSNDMLDLRKKIGDCMA